MMKYLIKKKKQRWNIEIFTKIDQEKNYKYGKNWEAPHDFFLSFFFWWILSFDLMEENKVMGVYAL